MRCRDTPDSSFVGGAMLEISDPALLRLFSDALSKIPSDVPPLRRVTSIRLRRRGSMRGVVGLTWCGVRYGRSDTGVTQTITFYTDLLYQLSDRAKTAVMAHELAHAWLNEHERPEQSRGREREADEVARRWGFGEDLAQLDEEAE